MIINDLRFKGRRSVDWNIVENCLKEYIGQCAEITETSLFLLSKNCVKPSIVLQMILLKSSSVLLYSLRDTCVFWDKYFCHNTTVSVILQSGKAMMDKVERVLGAGRIRDMERRK